MVGFLHDTTIGKVWNDWSANLCGASTFYYPWGTRLSTPCPDGTTLVEVIIWDSKVAEEAPGPGTMLGGSISLGSSSIGV